MSSREILNGLESLQRHKEFFTFSPERQRMEYYLNKNWYNTNYVYLYSDDDKVCLANEIRRVRLGSTGKAWAQSDKDRKGFTYDKHTKKVKLWYNSTMYSFSHHEMRRLFEHMNVQWFINIHETVYGLITPTMLGKVFSGKITDELGFCKEFIKSKPWLKNSDVTPEKFVDLLIYLYKNNRNTTTLGSYIQAFSVAKSGRVLCDKIMSNGANDFYRLSEIIHQALALDQKIDFSMPEQEIEKLSNRFKRMIMKLKLETNPNLALVKNGDRLDEVHDHPAYARQEPLLDLVMQDL
jgi:hypothetical protein